MSEVFALIRESIANRIDGPLHFRMILQPTMAMLLGIRAGVKDAREGKPAYFWSILTDPTHMRERLREGLKSTTMVFLLGAVMDAIYQVIALRWLYPGQALLVGFVSAFIPYLLIRGPANRVARLWL